MSELSTAVRHALAGGNMETVAGDIKQLLCDELARVDPDVSIHRTEYFNHSYLPDVVVEWGPQRHREVFLRFLTSADSLRGDAERLGGSEPVLFDLSKAVEPGPDHQPLPDAIEAEVAGNSPGLLLTDTEATEHIRPQDAENLVERIFVSNLLRGGRGHLSATVAQGTVQAARDGFDAAINADADPVRAVVDAARAVLAPEMERRIEKALQLLWWAGGGDPQQFPVTVPDDMELNPQDTQEFLRTLFTDEQAIDDDAFWGRLADRLDFNTLVAAGDVYTSVNLNRLMLRLAARLQVGHVILDVHARPFPPDDELAWGLQDRFLRLRGPEWTLSFADQGNRFSQRGHDQGQPIPLAEAANRTEGLLVEEAEIEEANRWVQLRRRPAEPGAQQAATVANLTAGFPDGALMRKLVVVVGQNSLAAKWDQLMLSSDPDATVQRLAQLAVRLLAAPPVDEQAELATFLGI